MKTKSVEFILDEAIKLRIQSFQLRTEQSRIFIESNALSIKALKHRLKNEMDEHDDVWKLSIRKKDEAHNIGIKCSELTDRSAALERSYNEIMNHFEGPQA